MAIDLFTPRAMLEAIKKLPPAGNFLRQMFFNREVTHNTRDIMIDVFKGGRKVAPYVSPNREAKVINKTGYNTNLIRLPYVKVKYDITSADTATRVPGENPFNAMTPADRAGKIMADLLMEGNESLERLLELQAAQALVTGKVTAQGTDDSAVDWSIEIDFGRDASLTITKIAGARWTVDTVNPLTDLRDWRNAAMKLGHVAPDVVVMGSSALAAFLENPFIASHVNSLNIRASMIDMSGFSDLSGVQPVGMFDGFAIYQYVQSYLHPQTGADTDMIPANTVILGSSSAKTRNAVNFGAIEDMEFSPSPIQQRIFPKSWVNQDPSARWLMLQSSPLVTLHEPDSCVAAQVVA